MTEPKKCTDCCYLCHATEIKKWTGSTCSDLKCVCHFTVPPTPDAQNYERVSHTHCWNNQPSPCGIPIEKHTQCCLCDLKVPDAPTSLDLIVADLQSKGYKVTNADAYKGNYFQYRPKDVPKLDDDMDAPTEGWEERFDELIPWEEIGWKAENVIKTKCKAFVTQALAEQKARMVEEVEGMKDEQLANAEGLMDDETRALKLVAIVKNQVCDSIIKALSK